MFKEMRLIPVLILLFSSTAQAAEVIQTTETKTTTTTATDTKNIDCSFHIPPQTVQIDTKLVLRWGEKAAQQSFDFEHSLMTVQLEKLKPCYTELGWQSFTEALAKSGNIEAIKKQQLMVSGIIDGQSSIVPLKTNQWKLTVPLQVVYQNAKEKINQKLIVDLVIGRKATGDLGIIQMIASPRAVPAKVPSATIIETPTGPITPPPSSSPLP